MKDLVSISAAARILGRHRPEVYRLLDAGILKRHPGPRPISRAELASVPRQRRKVSETCLARIRAAGHKPASIPRYMNEAAAGGAACDLPIHAGRLLLAGEKGFLDAIEKPPLRVMPNPETCYISRAGYQAPAYPLVTFAAFVGWRVRCFAADYAASGERNSSASTERLWVGFWYSLLRARFDVFPWLHPGIGIQFVPRWAEGFFPVTPYDKAGAAARRSFFAPAVQSSPEEKGALRDMVQRFPFDRFMEKHAKGQRFRREMISVQGGAPVPADTYLVFIQAMIAARHDSDLEACDLFQALGVPKKTARPFVQYVRRLLGHYRLARDDGSNGMKGYASGIEANKKDVAEALGISRPTLDAWTRRARPSSTPHVQKCPDCGGVVDDEMDTCPKCRRNLAAAALFGDLRPDTKLRPETE